MNHIAVKDDEGRYKVFYGRFVGMAETEAEAWQVVQEDLRSREACRQNADKNADNADSPRQSARTL